MTDLCTNWNAMCAIDHFDAFSIFNSIRGEIHVARVGCVGIVTRISDVTKLIITCKFKKLSIFNEVCGKSIYLLFDDFQVFLIIISHYGLWLLDFYCF